MINIRFFLLITIFAFSLNVTQNEVVACAKKQLGIKYTRGEQILKLDLIVLDLPFIVIKIKFQDLQLNNIVRHKKKLKLVNNKPEI